MRQKLYAGLLTLCMLVTLLPACVWATEADADVVTLAATGSFIVTGGEEDTDYTYGNSGVFSNVLTILTSTPLTITANDTVTDAMLAVGENVDANITINNLDIDLSNVEGSALRIPGGSSLNLTIQGENQLATYAGSLSARTEAGPGILVENDAKLTINGTDNDTLEVSGGQMDRAGVGVATGYAGIGGPNSSTAYTYTGEIVINGGVINAHGYGYGAGIGGGDYSSGGTITITGGTVTATTGEGLPSGWIDSSKANASGIGASQGQPGGVITITGGTVKAYGGYGSAGIGGGTADVTISGGTVVAYGGPVAAGIGGYDQNKGDIKITIGKDATVTAYAGRSASAIGQGSNTQAPVQLSIEKDAKVTAFSQEDSNRPAITQVSNLAGDPANMINAYITNMSLPADVPITANYGNETINLTVPAGTGGVAFTTEAAGEFIAKTADDNYQFILADNSKATVTSGTAFIFEQVQAVSPSSIGKEDTPNAQVDYENNRLTGLAPGAKYRVSYAGADANTYLDLTADENGYLTHILFPNFYGQNVSIIKLSSSESMLNSDPQWLQTEALSMSISIKTQPTKTRYLVGENISYDGLSVELAYKNTSASFTKDIAFTDFSANGLSISPANGTTVNTSGTQTVTISHTGGQTATFTLTFMKPEDLSEIFNQDENDPSGNTYLIQTQEDMKALATYVNNGKTAEGITFKVTNGIDLGSSEENPWTPIGNESNQFCGTFDGGGYTISGLYINDDDGQNLGLFSYLGNGGKIQNLTIADGLVQGQLYVGSFVGRSYGTIENCTNHADVTASNVHVGGIAGACESNNGAFINCHNTGSVSGAGYVGGIAGSSFGKIENCANTGNIEDGTIGMGIAGIVGVASQGIEITGCYNTGTITSNAQESYAGGIAGYCVNPTDISNCYNTGNVECVGRIVGGIAGYIPGGTISECYNTGSVRGSSIVSGVIGYMAGGAVQNCYSTGAANGTSVDDAITGGVIGFALKGTVENCYNIGTVTGANRHGGVFGGITSTEGDVSQSQNYYLDTCVSGGNAFGNPVSTTQFASGEVAYLLQNGQTDDATGTIPQVWGQTLSGETPDTAPILTDETAKIVYQVQFMANDAVYSVAYANPNGMVSLPEEPESTVYDFMRWSQTNSADGDEFTAQTPVTGNMTVYAVGQEMYGQTDTEKTISFTYGTGATQDLSDYMTYVGETDAAGKFTYTITGGNTTTETENGNTVAATINGDTLTIPADTNADTYTLTIQATEKQSVVTPFSVSYGTQPVTLTVTIVVNMAVPDYTVPDNLTAVYGQTLANITLPTGFTWQDTANTSVGDFGTSTFLVTFTPTNTSNYQTVTDIEVTIAVTKATPTVTLNVQNPQGVGENRSIDLAATVTGVTGGEVPTGTVEFFSGTESLGTTTVSEGTATYTWNNVPVGDHSLRAVYSGSDNYSTAEGTTSYDIDKDPQTELTIGGLPESVVYGGEPFTLTVTGGSGTGAVTYTVTSGESVSVDANGNVIIQKSGESIITVTKAADDNYNETTATVTINVAQASPTIDTPPTAGRVRLGNLLSTSALTGGVVTGLDGAILEGNWHWQNDREMTQSGTYEETAVFTPTDTNYAPVETTISVDVYTSTINNGGGGSAIIRYTVTFDAQGGSRISSQTVSRNSTVSEPSEPTKDGYTFSGWYTDAECTEAYDFSSGVTRNLTLYAKWTENGTSPSEPTATPEPQNPEEWDNPYTDVTEGDWFYDAVRYANENGLFNGMSETEFAPNTAITRGMLVTVLHRSEDAPGLDYAMTFTDVAQNAYYTNAVRWAASAGIVKGYSETEFAPDRLISREEMAAIMNRYANYKGIDTSAKGDLTQFTDAEQIADWARGNMEWAVGYGLLSGKDNNQLDPQGNTTRAEAAAILQRFFEK